MAWTFIPYEDEHKATNVVSSIANGLNGLTNNEQATSKVGLTDQRHNSSFGVLFYNKGADTPPVYNLTGAWTQYTWTWDSNDDYKSYYSKIADFLNGGTPEGGTPEEQGTIGPLTPSQAAYARFCMSDYDGGHATAAVFWQNS